MRTISFQFFTTRVLTAAALLCVSFATPAQDKVGSATTARAERPRSVFADVPQQGKDPFFPDSTRRLRALVQSTPSSLARPVASPQFLLKGISSSQSQPLALINNATMAVGELVDVKCGRDTVKVRCREIRDRSVLVEIIATGELHELKLRDGI